MERSAEDLSHYAMLTDAQRIRAKAQAKANLMARMGGEPRFEDFVRHSHKQFGGGAELIGFALAVIVLGAAFVISAVHVYGVGRETYLEGNTDVRTAVLMGAAFVVLAEASVLALSVLPTLWSTPPGVTRMMYAGILASAFIATVGNIDATIFYSSSPFHWIRAWWSSLATAPNRWALATLPPFLTVLVGLGLKYQLLTRSRERNAARQEYSAALETWQKTVARIEEHPEWRLAWFNALWDEWCRGRSRDVLARIDRPTKVAIVLREMQDEAQLMRELNALQFSEIAGANAASKRAPGRTNREVVEEFYRTNPGAIQMQQREIAEILGISESAVSRYRPNTNGQERP